jgi:CIC family chloride channel protein
MGLIVGIVGVLFFSVSQLLAGGLLGSLGNMPQGTHESTGTGWLKFITNWLPSADAGNPRLWLLVLIPATAGLLIGLFRHYAKDETGPGTGAAIESFHNQRGRFPHGTAIRKFIVSVLTLGGGGSAGREGPIALMGSTIGSWLGSRFQLTLRERRILLAAGIAAGVGGMFRAPLAGGLMAAEVLYSDSEFEPDVLIPAMIASVISYCVFCLNFGWGTLFGEVASGYHFTNPLELLPLTALAVALVLVGFVYVKTYTNLTALGERIPLKVRPMIGMGLAGAVTIGIYLASAGVAESGKPQTLLFAIMGDGYSALQVVLQGGGVWWVLLILVVGKMITNSLTNAGGAAGGAFAPSMVIGGCTGAAIGILFYQVLPDAFLPQSIAIGDANHLATVTAVFALVGMAGFWAAVAKVPISTVIIVSELTGSYHLLLPALWCCSITFLLSKSFQLFPQQVSTRRESPAHLGDFAANVLKEIKVSEILPDLQTFETVEESTSLEAILAMHSSRQAYYPVVDKDDRFNGIFSLNDLRAVLDETEVWQLLVAADIAHHDVLTVHPSETLGDVARKFAETSYDELPVVSDDDESQLLGMISRRQLNNAYIKRTMHYDQAAKAEKTRVQLSGRMRKIDS